MEREKFLIIIPEKKESHIDLMIINGMSIVQVYWVTKEIYMN